MLKPRELWFYRFDYRYRCSCKGLFYTGYQHFQMVQQSSNCGSQPDFWCVVVLAPTVVPQGILGRNTAIGVFMGQVLTQALKGILGHNVVTAANKVSHGAKKTEKHCTSVYINVVTCRCLGAGERVCPLPTLRFCSWRLW